MFLNSSLRHPRCGGGWGEALEVRVAGAGPFPIFGPVNESSANRVPFNVVADSLEFDGISDPMVERFVLPKGFAGAAQSGVDVTGGNSLERTRDFSERHERVQQYMDMVGHDDVSVQLVAAKLGAMLDGILGVIGKLRFREPERTALGRVQSSIEFEKFLSRKIFLF